MTPPDPNMAISRFKPEALAEYQRLVETVDQMIGDVEMIDVTSPVQAGNMNNVLGGVKTALATIELHRTRQLKPYSDMVKAINNAWRAPRETLEEAEMTAKRKLLAWTKAERTRIAREEEERRLAADEAREREASALSKFNAAVDARARAAAATEAKDASLALVVAESTAPVMPVRGVKTDGGDECVAHVTSGLRDVWRWKVLDEKAIPRQYWILDEKRLNAEVRGGARDIPGLSIYADEEISTRLS